MAKRTDKYKAGPEIYNAGCIRGIIRMLDFRNAPKLLLDRRHESSRHASGSCVLGKNSETFDFSGEVVNVKGNRYSNKNYHMLSKFEEKQESLNLPIQNEAGNGDFSSTSIRILMQEELSSLHLPKQNLCRELKNLKPELETGYEDTNPLGTCKVHCSNLEVSTNLSSGQSPFQDPLEVFPSDLNFGALLLEFYNNKYKDQILRTDHKDVDLFQSHSELQKALHEVLDPFYKLFVTNYDGKLPKSEEFMKASELMGLNKDTFLKYLQDPDASLLKQIREDPNFLETKTRDSGSLKQQIDTCSHNMSHKKNERSIFRKNNKFNGEDQSPEDQNFQQSKKIVLLKPVTTIQRNNLNVSNSNSLAGSLHCLKASNKNEKATSGFSFREIKRRLRRAIGERKGEHHLLSTNGNDINHRIKHSETAQGSNVTERAFPTATDNEKRENATNSYRGLDTRETCQPDIEKEFQMEVKNDLKILDYAVDEQHLSASQAHISLETLLNMPDHSFSSPKSSPGKHDEPRLLPKDIMLPPAWSPNCCSGKNQQSMLADKSESSYNITGSSNAASRLIEFEGLSKEDCSLGEISSSGFTPGKHKEPGLSPRLITFSPPWSPRIKTDTSQERTLLMYDTEKLPSTTNKSDDEVESFESNSNPPLNSQVEEFSSTEGGSNSSGDMDIIDIGGNELVEKQNSVESGTKISANATDKCEDYESPRSRLDILEFEKREPAKIITENPDGPSPISILEPPFSDDIASPETTDVDHVIRSPISPREIHFNEYDDLETVLTTSNNEIKRRTCMEEEEFKHDYILTLLEASGLNKYETWKRLHLSEQPLDTSLYYEVETPNGEIPDDLNLLFDCICEVLEIIRRRYFSSRPWLSSLRHELYPFPSTEKLVQEVLKGTTCKYDPKIPSTLNEIIKRDMDSGTWMGIFSGTEGVEVDVGDEILEDILEETVLELWACGN